MMPRCCLATAAIFCLLAVQAVAAPTGGESTHNESAVNESARRIPIAHEVDVLVVGGGSGAVSSAVAAAEAGASVFLAAPFPYLGDDMTATLRLWLEEDEIVEVDFIFSDSYCGNMFVFVTYTPPEGPDVIACGMESYRHHFETSPDGEGYYSINFHYWLETTSRCASKNIEVNVRYEMKK